MTSEKSAIGWVVGKTLLALFTAAICLAGVLLLEIVRFFTPRGGGN